ncbi:MAG: hypothetical protein II973_11250 [Spirochaetaceae bacterium]|nr:hypothetical protein [Spirochaetaceae bacterium]
MKKTICILGILLCAAALFAVQNGETVYVAVKKAAIKSGTGNFDKVVAQASYGDELVVDKASNKFHRVHKASDPSITGWIPATSVTTKKIIASSKKVTASADEIALAGKGFSEQVEDGYKTSNKKLDYASVDKLESFRITDSSLKTFLEDGDLNGAE